MSGPALQFRDPQSVLASPVWSGLRAALNKGDRQPLHLQLTRLLRETITRADMVAEEPIPPERQLAEALDVSRVTVRKALTQLTGEGLLNRRRGAGTFVAPRIEKNFSHLTSFSEDMLSRGHRPSSQWLDKTHSMVTPDEALALGLSPGSRVARLRRLRFADDEAVAIESTVLPAYVLPDLAAVTHSLYDVLARGGFRPTRGLQRLRAVILTPAQAELLNVAEGSAGLHIERRGYLPDGRVCEINHSVYRGDAYDVVAEVHAFGE
ncbi:GntR family transcriptional regulator [Asticcacaulis sp. AND118]|uniref:GntR family transcriptional regulator n=1 Tax=Asticcacaulis sp. AND118 TaxID=2840468 RepID=UPI001CFFD5D8|nr:GntR family transcriptional regulator [Asticcacaulis sp. AND118]UDF05716.1 GntR family transcriptional regulator [Asticcacaulis sp. AND118]